ncbi:uncharacterized protein LOC101207660 [Cucumis sativus]|uniref:HNH nuclease domain-containing protein n=1 Tax=Cucumis sativus TaxID=3659 RepID=A0A0A0LG99_CUCSA|nr:uncharacterized protein LOC101207660 [Cucumis sativus]XP_031738556.1 uncharacterized protein LOC101207660 [Cucumis sativus]KGN59772.1 hypothetical protein Csa_001958 [Cucumis sativus]
MAQFTAHTRLKLLLNGDGLPFGSESKDRFRYKLRSVRPRRFPLSRPSSSTTSSTSALRKPTQHAAEVRVGVRDESVNGGDDDVVGFDYDYELESDDLACFRGLVLDISYRPVNVVCWKRAICLEFMEKADVLEYYDQTVNSPSGSFYIPAVLRVPHLLQVVKRRRIKNSLSRKNILYRDNYTCQYCSSHESLTIDHVLPISRGGEWTWENLVAACVKCNSKKGQKTVEEANMKLKKTPKAPKDYDILAIPLTSTAIKMLKLRKGTPEEWRQYLSSEQ